MLENFWSKSLKNLREGVRFFNFYNKVCQERNDEQGDEVSIRLQGVVSGLQAADDATNRRCHVNNLLRTDVFFELYETFLIFGY